MQIKSLNKLPISAKKMWDKVYETASSKGHNTFDSARIALEVVKRDYTPVQTTKSISLVQDFSANESDNYIDVLLGKPMLDAHGELYTEDFWRNSPMTPITFDMEHQSMRKALGLLVDDPEEWEGFTAIADKYYHKGDELWAKVELPKNHPFTPSFKQKWEAGELGASVETKIPDEAVEYRWVDNRLVPHVTGGEITGATFTSNPAIDTKNKNDQ